jgi:UDP-glucose 4-epimerase
MKIFITGATGFLGQQLVLSGTMRGEHELLLLARDGKKIPENLNHLLWLVSDIQSLTPEDLRGVDVVIHTAAKAHDTNAPESEYIINNSQATRHLAECAAKAGVRRFIFISTIKVHGEYSLPNQPFHATDKPNPCDAYARSKLESEQQLQTIAGEHGMDWVIIRPPLIYGSQVKGNLQKLANLIRKKIPLPFGAIKNERSILSVDNMVDALWHILILENASKQIFLISDGKPVSTPDLIRHIAKSIGVSPILIPIPEFILRLGCRLLGKKGIYTRTCMSLRVDDSDIRKKLNWSPPFTTEEAMKKAML